MDDPEVCLLDYYVPCTAPVFEDGLCEFHYDMAQAGMLRGLNEH